MKTSLWRAPRRPTRRQAQPRVPRHPAASCGWRAAVARLLRPAALLMRTLLLLGAGTGLAWSQQANLQSYDVELIIFRTLATDATAEGLARETAAASAYLPRDEAGGPATATEVNSPATAVFAMLPASRYQLNAIAATLRRSRDYRPLAHFGWTQPGYPPASARALSIDSLVPAGSGLSGQVTLARGRYLHLAFDIALQGASAGQPATRDVLRQSRRMRSNERHYIDHPNFGIIAVITKAEP